MVIVGSSKELKLFDNFGVTINYFYIKKERRQSKEGGKEGRERRKNGKPIYQELLKSVLWMKNFSLESITI